MLAQLLMSERPKDREVWVLLLSPDARRKSGMRGKGVMVNVFVLYYIRGHGCVSLVKITHFVCRRVQI